MRLDAVVTEDVGDEVVFGGVALDALDALPSLGAIRLRDALTVLHRDVQLVLIHGRRVARRHYRRYLLSCKLSR